MSKKFNVGFKEGKLGFGLDLNKDGENSISLVLHLNEALQEAINRGEKIEGAKLVDFKFELTKLKLVLDTDQDGEKLMELTIDLGEALDEGKSLMSKAE